MENLLDNFKGRKNLISVIVVGILIIAVPVGIYLIRQTQIFKSRATGESIKFAGNNVTQRADGTWAIVDGTHPTIALQLTTTLGEPETPAPSVSPSAPVTSPPGPAAPTVSFTANPSIITVGQSTTLTWSSTNATKCFLDSPGLLKPNLDPSGSDTFSPTETITYNMRCEGSGGATNPARASVTVTVKPPLPCTGKSGAGCTFDTQAVYVQANGTRRETVTAYGRYWNWDEQPGAIWKPLDSNGSTLASYARYANGPCAGQSGANCKFDTQTIYVRANSTLRRDTVTANGKYWNWDEDPAASGGWSPVGTMGGDLSSVNRYNTASDYYGHPGPCYSHSPCRFDTQTVYVRSDGTRRETVTAYGKYWNWDEASSVDKSDPTIAPKIIDNNWIPLDSNSNDLSSYARYASGPCQGQSSCKFDTHTVYVRANSTLRRETITAYGKYWNWDEDPAASGGWSPVGTMGGDLTSVVDRYK